MTRLVNKLQRKLDKEYGIFGDIIVKESDDRHNVQIIFEENDYLYEALNCFSITMYDEVEAFINTILDKYGLYFELESNCVATISI